jgi:membrane-bound lytic murein transglycosylase F
MIASLRAKAALLITLLIALLFVWGIVNALLSLSDFNLLHTPHLRVEDPLQRIEKTGKIRVVCQNNSTAYFIYKGRPMGFHYDMIKKFAENQGWEFEIIIQNDLQKALRMLEKGEVDIATFDLTHTLEREKEMQFTLPIGTNQQVLVQRKKADRKTKYLNRIFDLQGVSVHIHKDCNCKENLKHLMNMSATKFRVIEEDSLDTEALMEKVANGELDYIIGDERTAKVYKSLYPNLDYQLTIGEPQQVAWAVSKNSDSLLKTINYWLVDFRDSRYFNAIENKYFTNISNDLYANEKFISVHGEHLSPYDALIKKHAKTIHWDWRLLAALVYHESHFNPDAESWGGAKGLLQLMPETASRFGLKDPFDAEQNLKAGTRYLQYLMKQFENDQIPEEERIKFAIASYNVGLGHVKDAQALAEKLKGNPHAWSDGVDTFIVLKTIPKYYNDPMVKHGFCQGKFTKNYVKEIYELYFHYCNLVN